MADKNVLTFGHELWRRVFKMVAIYPEQQRAPKMLMQWQCLADHPADTRSIDQQPFGDI
jgi:hypothetical protein